MKGLMYIWKNKWRLMIVSVLVTAIFFGSYCYRLNYTESMKLSLIYPNSEKGKYPDGTRFNIYDMMSDDVLKGAIEAYNEEAENPITVSDIEDCIQLKEQFTDDVASKIEQARDLGMDYTYFANEYNVTFKPVFKIGISGSGKPMLFKPYVDNKLFMEKFYETYVDYFMQQHAEKNIISGLSKEHDTDSFDYLEIGDIYTNQVNMCINYLNGKNAENGSFRSSQTGLTFNDLINSFRNLKNVQVQNLVAFVSSSKLTKDANEFINKMKVENELNNLEYSKYKAESDLSKQAMNQYDHTFEENIVVAGVSEDDGLYQTRAKTAYDTITKRAHDAGVNAENLYKDIEENERLIKEYSSATMDEAEKERLSKIADDMIAEIEKTNEDLVQKANTTVEEYLKTKSSNYVRREVANKSYINMYIVIECAVVFICAGFLTLLLLIMTDFGIKRKSRRPVLSKGRAMPEFKIPQMKMPSVPQKSGKKLFSLPKASSAPRRARRASGRRSRREK